MVKANDESGFIDLVFEELTPEEMNSRAVSFYQEMNKRRTTRHFSTRKVSRPLIEAAIKTAGTAPSGAHLQPWTRGNFQSGIEAEDSPSGGRGREENIL